MAILGAMAVVLDRGRVLLMQREDFRVWCLPGGHLDPGETPAQAAIREIREETGLEARLLRLTGMISAPRHGDGGMHIAVFLAEPTGGSLITSTNESVDAGFFDPGSLPEKTIWYHRAAIRDALRNDDRAALYRRDFRLSVGRDFAEARERLRNGEIALEEVQRDLCAIPPDGGIVREL